ncbi:MAG: MarR family transcriptional regulator [Solobacterium sp.]|nr:MarR family transcriptional regulator [Solobacterium sp.]
MDISFKLKRVNDEMFKQANNRLQKDNMTFSQLFVLVYLYREAKDMTASLKELERRFEVAQATMAGIASRLEAKGFVEGVINSQDRRVKQIHLTPQGLEFLKKNHQKMEEHNKHLVQGLSEEELNQLNRYLDIIYQNILEDE